MSNFNIAALPRWLRDFAPLIIWMTLLFLLSNRSTLLQVENQAGEITLYKFAHFIAYGILTWFWWRAISPRRNVSWRVLFAAVGLTFLYAITDEIHQLYVPGRHGRLADVLFDTSGALAMILLLRQFKSIRKFPESLLLFQEYSPKQISPK